MSSSDKIQLHKLQNSWVIYEQIQFYENKDRGEGYKDSFEAICIFDTVEGFWLNWNRIPTVTSLFSFYSSFLADCSLMERAVLLRERMNAALKISL